jgi:hypothetical protein
MGPEKKIETKACRELKQRGALSVKLNLMGQRSWPDRLFIVPPPDRLRPGRIVLIEFKAPGEPLTPAQADLHRKIRRRGFEDIFVCSSVEGALAACGFSRAVAAEKREARAAKKISRSGH